MTWSMEELNSFVGCYIWKATRLHDNFLLSQSPKIRWNDSSAWLARLHQESVPNLGKLDYLSFLAVELVRDEFFWTGGLLDSATTFS